MILTMCWLNEKQTNTVVGVKMCVCVCVCMKEVVIVFKGS